MNYSEIDWSRLRNGNDNSTPILTKNQEIKNISLECVGMGLSIRQSVDLIVSLLE